MKPHGPRVSDADEEEEEAGQTVVFSVMSRVELEPDLDQTHSSSVQLIMQGCRQLWPTLEAGTATRREEKMK